MRILLPFIYFLFINCICVGQFIIEGQVVEELSNEPLPLGEIKSSNGLLKLSTDFEGKFSFHSASSNDTISFYYLGFATQKKTVKELLSVDKIQLKAVQLEDPSVVTTRMKFIKGNIFLIS